MKCAIALCVLLGISGAMGDGKFLGGMTDMMNKAAGTVQQVMGGAGGNPFMDTLNQVKSMMEKGGGDSIQNMQEMLQNGLANAPGAEVQKQFEDAIQKMESMVKEGASPDAVLQAVNTMMNQG